MLRNSQDTRGGRISEDWHLLLAIPGLGNIGTLIYYSGGSKTVNPRHLSFDPTSTVLKMGPEDNPPAMGNCIGMRLFVYN